MPLDEDVGNVDMGITVYDRLSVDMLRKVVYIFTGAAGIVALFA